MLERLQRQILFVGGIGLPVSSEFQRAQRRKHVRGFHRFGFPAKPLRDTTAGFPHPPRAEIRT